MNRIFKYPVSLLLLFAIVSTPRLSAAQSDVTFIVDMKQQLKDSTFIPSLHDLKIKGNRYPFTKTRTFTLTDEPPADSLYTVTINFSPRSNDKMLEYYYLIDKGSSIKKERRTRLLLLRNRDMILDKTYFNAFAH